LFPENSENSNYKFGTCVKIMTNLPSISVVLPIYNGATTLASAIRSVLDQTFRHYELLLLDDGSTDDSFDIAKTFSDPRIRVIHDGLNYGLAYRLNQGIDLARGRYIARMDQDDICFPERLAKQFEFLETHPEIDLLGCRAIAFNDHQIVLGLIPFHKTHEEICAHPWRGLYLIHPSWTGRAEWFRKHHYQIPEPVCAEDQELLLRTYPESRFACLDDVLLAYKKHFRLNKSLQARRTLVRVQLSHFINRRQWCNAIASIMSVFGKTFVDYATLLPVFRRFLLTNRFECAPEVTRKRFEDLIIDYGYHDET
jgi:glycosyltransferase involved in cell wall biosynthesis